MQKVTNNVYVGNKFRGCNSSFVVTSEGVVVIDTPMVPSEARQWREEARRHGEIKYVINNEPHNDHVAGDCWFSGSPLVTHEDTRHIMEKMKPQEMEEQLKWMAPDALPLDKEFHYRLPEITFSEKLTLYVGDHSFQLIHMPGHTPCETAVYVPEERIVFTSDNVVQGMPIMVQAVPHKWLESLKQLQQLDIDIVVPGHGKVCDKAYLQQMYDNVKYCVDEVKTAVDKGWSLKEIQEKVTFSDRFPPSRTGDFMKSVRLESIARIFEALK
jgi:cyclase